MIYTIERKADLLYFILVYYLAKWIFSWLYHSPRKTVNSHLLTLNSSIFLRSHLKEQSVSPGL